MLPGQLSLFESRKARDEGMEKTRSKNSVWLKLCLTTISSSLWHEWVGSGEDLRDWLLAPPRNMPSPTHPNAWGSLIREATTKGLIEKTGRYVQMRQKSSHARMTPEYRRT